MQNTELLHSIYSGDIQKTKTLMDNGSLLSEDEKNNILLAAASEPPLNSLYLITEDREAIINFLLKIGANVNYLYSETTIHGDTLEETPLTKAVQFKNINIVTLLIENEADINIEVNHSTPLCMAIENKSIEIVQYLLDNGADINFSDENGNTPLMIAIKSKNYKTALCMAIENKSIEIVQYLLDNGADINFSDENGNTPLMVAIKNNVWEIAELLIQHNADLTLRNYQEETALMMFGNPFDFTYKDYEKDTFENVSNIMSILLKEIDINAHDKNGTTALIKYINVEHRLTEFLLKNGADIDIADNAGKTPLFYAINNHSSFNLKSYVQYLVKKGAEINIQTKDGETALMRASAIHDPDTVKYLIEAGANIHLKDKKGQTALLKACQSRSIGISVQGGTVEGMVDTLDILIKEKSDINVKDKDGNTAFMLVEKYNLVDAMKMLIDYGVDIKKENIDLENLFVKSLFYRDNFELANYLLDKKFVDINYKDEEENTFLLLISESKPELKVLEYLIKKGIDLNIKNKNNETVLTSYILSYYKAMNQLRYNNSQNKQQETNDTYINIINFLIKSGANTKVGLEYLIGIFKQVGNEYFEFIFKLLMRDTNFNITLKTLLFNQWINLNSELCKYNVVTCIFLIDLLKIELKNLPKNNNIFNSYKDDVIKIENILFSSLDNNSSKSFKEILEDYVTINSTKNNTIYNSKPNKNISSILSKTPHKPKELVRILSLFTQNNNDLKYTTHSWDMGQLEHRWSNFDDFLKSIKKEWKKIDEKLKAISPRLYTKIESFLFNTELGMSWGENKLEFGWSSPELKVWCNQGKNPNEYILEENKRKVINNIAIDRFSDIVAVFKNEIEIRSDKKQIKTIFRALKKSQLGNDFKLKLDDSLDSVEFYTDVQELKKAINRMFIIIKERTSYPEIKVKAEKNIDSGYIDISIIQVGSTTSKEPQEIINKIKQGGGDMAVILKDLSSLCEWSIEYSQSINEDTKSFRLDLLNSDTQTIEYKELDNKIEGFTHILRFYK